MLRLFSTFGLSLCLVFGALEPGRSAEPEIVEIQVSGAGAGGGPAAMATQVFKPPGAGPFPVLLFSHGRSGKAEERADLKNPVLRGHAEYWMRKGFAVVAPIRPGYGAGGGSDRESSGSRLDAAGECAGDADARSVFVNSTAAVRSALDWVRGQKWAKRDVVVLAGQSVGGATTVFLAATNPPGVVGYVNFAGGTLGYPDRRPGRSCFPEKLEVLYGEAGTKSRVPGLWLYAENDLYWGADAPRRWHAAYAKGGAKSTFVMTGPVPNEDGHRLLARGGKMWSVHVDAFVGKLGL